ncbi:hypothetical protein AAMO2058_001720600 [Amorphochlora amoebiformis]
MASTSSNNPPVCCLQPAWITHLRKGGQGVPPPIYSVHIHPDGTRFATGGADFSVKVWSMQPLIDDSKFPPRDDEEGGGVGEEDGEAKRLLAEMKNHNGAVNCVKWSSDGRLASGSDDKSVMIWSLDSTNTQPSAFMGQVSHERWSCKAVLSGGTTEVQDITWNPTSEYIASCHVDNTIIIWNASEGRQHKVLRGHKGWVTGLAWDPKDRFIASQGMDGTVMIWNVDDGACVRTLEEPFETKTFGRIGGFRTDLTRQATFTRLSWSYDGSFLGACRGYYSKSKDFVSPVFQRGSWKHDIDYLGHKRPTTVIRFSPLPLRTISTREVAYAVAVGGMDGATSIWVSTNSKMIMSLTNFFSQTVLDIAWTPDGSGILVCSHDGTVCFFRLDLRTHLGLEPGHGSNGKSLETSQDTFVETPQILALRQRLEGKSKATDRKRGIPSNMITQTLPPPAKRHRRDVSQLQTETVTKSGKRRITPITATPIPISGSSGIPAVSSTKSDSAPEKVNGTIHCNVPDEAETEACLRSLLQGDQKMGKKSANRMIRSHRSPSKDKGGSEWKVIMQCGRDTEWEQEVTDKVVSVCTDGQVVVAGCEDRLIHLFSRHGRRLSLPLVAQDKIFKIAIKMSNGSRRESVMLIASCDGSIKIYSVGTFYGARVKEKVTCSLHPLRERHGSRQPSALWITDKGLPCVKFPDMESYEFDEMSKLWALTSESKYWASEFQSLLFADENETQGEKNKSEKKLKKLNKFRLLDAPADVVQKQTVQHLEHYLCKAQMRGIEADSTWALAAYVRRLAQMASPPEGIESQSSDTSTSHQGNAEFRKLKELCYDLLSPGSNNSGNPNDSETKRRRDILKGLMPYLAMGSKIQSFLSLLDHNIQQEYD